MVYFVLSSIGMLISRPHPGSSSGLWNWLTYGWLNADSALILFIGLNCSNLRNKSSASADADGKMSVRGFAATGGIDSNIVAAKGLLIASISEADGLPVTSIILSSWFIVDDPGKSG